MNFPNILSVSRIFLSIPIIILFENESYLLSIIFFIIASVTDYLDGFLARKQNLVTKTGALLDLLADKIFVSVILIWMTFTFESVFILVASILIISREIAVSYLRLFIISNNKETRELQPDLFGKLKTALQMVGIGCILITPITPYFFFNLSLSLIFSGVVFSWYSFFRYLNKWLA